jgi:hypothetical protein
MCYDGGDVVAVATDWAGATPWSPVLSVVITDIAEIYSHGVGMARAGLDSISRIPIGVFVCDPLD